MRLACAAVLVLAAGVGAWALWRFARGISQAERTWLTPGVEDDDTDWLRPFYENNLRAINRELGRLEGGPGEGWPW